MNKKGFTLVELLAVIIILSLLALLTSTAVTKLVKDAKDDLSSTQIELIRSAAQTWGADNLTGLPGAGECSYLTVSNLKDYGLLDSNLKELNTNTPIPDDLKIKISTARNQNSGKLITTYEVNPQSVDGCYKQLYNNGEVVYFNVEEGKGCTEGKYNESYDESLNDYLNSKTGYNGYKNYNEDNEESEKTSTQNSCLKFYAFLDDGSEKLNLLLDHNAGESSIAMGSILELLYNHTKDWNVPNISKNYVLNRDDGYLRNYEIEYIKIPEYDGALTPFKARLIEAQEVAKITGADVVLNWDENTATLEQRSYYLDGAKGTDKTWQTQVVGSDKEIKQSDYYWLYDRTRKCKNYGCKIEYYEAGPGYATSFFMNPISDTLPDVHIIIYYHGSVAGGPSSIGVRPVIEVLKSNLQ